MVDPSDITWMSAEDVLTSRDFLAVAQEVPVGLPLLDEWMALEDRGKPLAGWKALLIQHQFTDLYAQVKAYIDLGLDPKDLIWLDIPYTSNADVRRAIETLGVPAENFISIDRPSFRPYSSWQRSRTLELLTCILSDPPERLLVVDDGAYFLDALTMTSLKTKQLALVEQTARGTARILANPSALDLARSVPFVDVASSRPKKTLESPFIGDCVGAALIHRLREEGPIWLERAQVLLLGFGAIGREVARALESFLGIEPWRIHIGEPDRDNARLAIQRGHPLWNRASASPQLRFDLVIGCSGEASFRLGDWNHLADEARLASASSGSVELSRDAYLELVNNAPEAIPGLTLETDIETAGLHDDISLRVAGRQFSFLNGGFPVNFDGRALTIPAFYIQPTVVMMVQAAYQAVTGQMPGDWSLDPRFERWLEARFRDQLGDEVARLDAPETPASRPPIS